MYCDLWTIGTWGHPSPPRTCWRLKWMVPKNRKRVSHSNRIKWFIRSRPSEIFNIRILMLITLYTAKKKPPRIALKPKILKNRKFYQHNLSKVKNKRCLHYFTYTFDLILIPMHSKNLDLAENRYYAVTFNKSIQVVVKA